MIIRFKTYLFVDIRLFEIRSKLRRIYKRNLLCKVIVKCQNRYHIFVNFVKRIYKVKFHKRIMTKINLDKFTFLNFAFFR